MLKDEKLAYDDIEENIGNTRVALLENGLVTEIYIDRKKDRRRPQDYGDMDWLYATAYLP